MSGDPRSQRSFGYAPTLHPPDCFLLSLSSLWPDPSRHHAYGIEIWLYFRSVRPWRHLRRSVGVIGISGWEMATIPPNRASK